MRFDTQYCRVLCFYLLITFSGFASSFQQQSQLSDFAAGARIQFGVADNFKTGGGFYGYLELDNRSATTLPAGEGAWHLYLHSIRKLDSSTSTGLRISHIQGDLHQIVPTPAFKGLAPGQSLRFEFTGANWIVSASDFMPRVFIAASRLKPVTFANTDVERLQNFVAPFRDDRQRLRQVDDQTRIATAGVRFAENASVNSSPVDLGVVTRRIFPTPRKVHYKDSHVTVDHQWKIDADPKLAKESDSLRRSLHSQAGLRLGHLTSSDSAHTKRIEMRIDRSEIEPEAYRLDIASEVIRIYGSDATGVFYGMQSLLGLIPANAKNQKSLKFPILSAQDAPRYSWRGMHYDMARNFHGLPVTLQLIEQMGRYKLNKLHLHLTDDEGWRLQIPGLPELTEIGATRCFDLDETRCLLTQLGTGPFATGSGNGFYTREEFVRLLKFAAERHIEVIPEIDMPGHARAAIKAMQVRYRRLSIEGKEGQAEQFLLSDPNDLSVYSSVQNYNDNAINVCRESTYSFIRKVSQEISAMYQEAGLQMDKLHVGGDEVGKGAWLGSPDCKRLVETGMAGNKDYSGLKQYFAKRSAELLQSEGVAMMGWEDGLMHDAVTPFARDALLNPRVIANVWDNIWEWGVADRAYRLANEGYQVVLSHATHLYFDHPQAPSPYERGYYWATRFIDSAKVFGYMPDHVYANADFTRMGAPIEDLQKTVGRPLPKLERPKNILGMQGQVWSETIRTAEQLEQMVYPRMLLLAERAWHKAEWEGDVPNKSKRDIQWAETIRLLTSRELPKLRQQGVSVYLPTPGVLIEYGKAFANSAFPGLPIQYSVDAGYEWHNYNGPVELKGGAICFRVILADINSEAQCVPE